MTSPPVAADSMVRPALIETESNALATNLRSLYLVSEASAAVADLSDRRALEKLASLIARERTEAGRRTCRIDVEGVSYWSPCYAPSSTALEEKIEVSGRVRGKVVIGYPDITSAQLSEALSERQSAQILATIVCRALSVKVMADQAKQSEFIRGRDRDQIDRAERLLGLGSWEFDPSTSGFSWSTEARQILGIREHNALRRKQRNPLIAHLRGVIAATKGSAPFRYEFVFADGEGIENAFEAFGEVRSPGAGTSFGFVRALTHWKGRNSDTSHADFLT